MSAADVHSILYRGEDPLKKKFVPKNEEKTHVPRHWPGKAPEGVADESDSPVEKSGSEEEGVEIKQLRMRQVLAADRRLHRLAAAASAAAAAQSAPRRREAFVIQSERERQRLEKGLLDSAEGEAAVLEDEWQAEEEEGAAAATSLSRAQLRAAALEQRRKEEKLLQQQQQQEQDISEESEESEYSEASEDMKEEADVVLLKPTFVSKANRLTVMEREERQRREQAELAQRQQQEEQRKLETKHMVYAALAREDEAAEEVPLMALEHQQHQQSEGPLTVAEDAMPDDTDGLDAAQEYEDWKCRELARIKRDKEEREKRGKFLEAVERRRLMTEEERREDDKELDKMQPKREIRHKYHFMQKYYHRGAFFQDLARSGEEPIYLRDFNAPVGEDAVDKKNLPKVLQLRRGELAKGGRTKHTHLVDVDTSDLSHPWALVTREMQGQKLLKKAAGLKGSHEFERPSLRKPRPQS
ncbi:hypothetical protein Esti_005231 [Eimeria stiedai]